MAPAGSYEALQAAVQAGADAVYFGVGQLNMRSKSAANFTPDDLERIVGIARAAGVKSYLTVNTVIYEDELRQMHALVDRARAAQARTDASGTTHHNPFAAELAAKQAARAAAAASAK